MIGFGIAALVQAASEDMLIEKYEPVRYIGVLLVMFGAGGLSGLARRVQFPLWTARVG